MPWQKIFRISRRITWVLVVALIATVFAYMLLDEPGGVPSFSMKVLKKIPTAATLEHPKEQGAAHPNEATHTPSADAAPFTLPEDSPSFKKEFVEYSASGFLPKKKDATTGPLQAYQRASSLLLSPGLPKICLIVSHLGDHYGMTQTVLDSFPNTVTLAFFPDGPSSQGQQHQARLKDYETLMMLPLEPMSYPKSDPGPHTLLTGLEWPQNQQRLYKALGMWTGYVGVLTYQGGRFTRIERDYKPVIQEVVGRGLLFVDGFSHPRSLTQTISEKYSFQTLNATYYLDPMWSLAHIETFLQNIEKEMSDKNICVIQVPANPKILPIVQRWVLSLLEKNVQLVPVSFVLPYMKKHGKR